ncbi:MAG: hypothetical protein KAJ48_01485 [Elusimicrobiales bacterium]|nr:hypothetical protein [Elusimicrobiales bacterium]
MKSFKKTKVYYEAIAVMIGYIIGVGMFGLPFVVSKSGVLVFFAFIVFFGCTQYLLHLIYANLIISTKKYHRLPGYAEMYLGRPYKYLAFFAKIVGNLGALLAYLIITGIFLHELLGPILGGSEFVYSTLLFLAGAGIVYFGIGAIAKVEFYMTGLLLLVILLIVSRGWETIDLANFTSVSWAYVFLPYGAMLMALDGNGSLPIVIKLLRRDREKIKSVVRVSTALSAIIVIAFTLVVVGISGNQTTPDALVGMKQALTNSVVLFSLVFGVLTMITSYLLVAESVKETLWWDFKINKRGAWAVAVLVPYLCFVFGLRNLTDVISFAGGVTGSLAAILLILIFRKLKLKKYKLPLFKRQPGNIIIYFLLCLFTLGVVYEIYYFITK